MELLGPTVLVIMLAILVRGVSAMLITCTTSGTLNTTGSVQCHFNEDINSTQRNFNIIYYPFGPNMTADYSKSNQVLACNWLVQAPFLQCNFKDGFTYPKEVGNTTTLTIVKVLEENLGFYICQLVPDAGYDVRLCNLSENNLVNSSDNKNPVPIATHSSVPWIVVGVIVPCLFILIIISIVIFVLRRRRKRNRPRNFAGDERILDRQRNQISEEDPVMNVVIEPQADAAVDEQAEDEPLMNQIPAVLEPQAGAAAIEPNNIDNGGGLVSGQDQKAEKHTPPLAEPQHVRRMTTEALYRHLLGHGVKKTIVKVFSEHELNGTNFEKFANYKEKLLKKKKLTDEDFVHLEQVLRKLEEARDKEDKQGV